MELRSFHHLHLIKTVKGGLVTRVLNVSRGRPGLVFKCVKDVYEEAQMVGSYPVLTAKDDVGKLSIKSANVKIENHCLPAVNRKTIECIPESSGPDGSSGDERRDSDLEDMVFTDMTLKQIKESRKTKKRKRSKTLKSIEETCSEHKQDFSKPQIEEDELDLTVPLSCLKSKLSKKKAKRKCKKNSPLTLSEGVLSVVKSEEFNEYEDFLQHKGDILVPASTEVSVSLSDNLDEQVTVCVAIDSSSDCNSSYEVEVPKLDCEDARYMICVPGDSSAGCNSAVETPESDSSDGQIAAHVAGDSSDGCSQNASCVVGVTESDCSDANLICVAAHSPFNCNEDKGSFDVETPEPDCSDSGNMLCIAAQSSTELNAAYECVVEAEVPVPLSFSEEAQGFLVDEDCVYMEPAHPKSLSVEKAMGMENMVVCDSESIKHHYSELHVPEPSSEEYISLAILDELSSEAESPTDDCSDIYDNSQSCSSMTSMSWQTNSQPRIEVHDKIIGTNLQNMELNHGGGQLVVENDYPAGEEKQPASQDSCLAPGNDLPGAEEKQRLLLTVAGAARETSSGINHYAATNDLEALPEDGNCDCTLPQQIPKRLFCARKSISPTSRKRLCKALESDGCCNEETYKYGGELSFGKQTANEHTKFGDPNQVSPDQKKPKSDKKGSPPKGNLKVSHLSRAKPSLSSGCDSIRICSENAIAFSQQQMRDIERIATRLTEELRLMKGIVEERFCSQGSPTKLSRYDADEVRMTIANAKKAEETTQKWLTMMAKDCRRFCKIMSLTEKDSSGNAINLQSLTEKESSSASGNAVHKQRKITFADEAGGKLCHVKIFETNLTSPSEPSCEQPELVAAQL